MRNPRSTTFNLTSIQSQRGSPKSARKYSPRHEKTKALGAAPDQENRLRNLVQEYKIKNQNLAEFIQHFENSTTDLNERDNLIRDLQIVLIKHTSSLERRMKKISDIEKQVLIFRKVSNEEEELDKQFPIKLPDDSYRTHSARNNRRRMDFLPPPKYQKPKRRIFPPPKIEKIQDTHSTNPLTPLSGTSNLSTINSDFNQSNLKKEREKLTQKTLYLDRLISIEKLKLKLFHDHRTLSELKSELDIMQSEPVNYHRAEENEEEAENNQTDEYDFQNNNDDDNFDEDESDVADLKNSIELIKERIQNERKRISSLENKYFLINDAATDIQRAWRGFIIRKSQKEGETNEETQDIKNEDDDKKNEIISNSENNNVNNANEEENLNENVNEEENLNEKVSNEENLNTEEESINENSNENNEEAIKIENQTKEEKESNESLNEQQN